MKLRPLSRLVAATVVSCPPPDMEDDDDTSHLFSRTSRKVISEAQKELDRKLQNVGVTPSQRHGMRMPPPRTSAWQDCPTTPENIQCRRVQLEQPLNESGPSKPPQQKHQPAALPPPWEKSTRKKTVPEWFSESNVYGKKHPVEVEKDILRQRDWKKVVGEESSCPHRQNIPGGVPVPNSVPYYSSDEEGGDDDESDDSEDKTREMLGSPSPSEEEEAVVSRLSREGGVSFLSFLVSKAVPVREEKEPKEWTYKDMIGLPAGQLEEWQAACQREIETLTKRHVFDMVVRPNGCRVIRNRWVFDVKPNGRKRARLVAKGFSQVEGKDFDQIFSPVVRFETVYLILALAALEGWYLSGLDVRNTYLYGELEEEIYMVFRVVSGCGQIGRISRTMATLETGQDPPYKASEHREETSQRRRHWGQGPKYPPGTCWIHWEYRQQVTPMCPVGKSWVY